MLAIKFQKLKVYFVKFVEEEKGHLFMNMMIVDVSSTLLEKNSAFLLDMPG